MAQQRRNDDALADPGAGNAVAHRNDMSAAIGPLDTREAQRRTGPTPIRAVGLGEPSAAAGTASGPHGLRVPADSRIDVGVVHACRLDAYQHLPGTGPWYGHVSAVDEPVEAAVAGKQRRAHPIGDGVIRVSVHVLLPLKEIAGYRCASLACRSRL